MIAFFQIFSDFMLILTIFSENYEGFPDQVYKHFILKRDDIGSIKSPTMELLTHIIEEWTLYGLSEGWLMFDFVLILGFIVELE